MPKKVAKKSKKAVPASDMKKFQQRNFSKPDGFKRGSK